MGKRDVPGGYNSKKLLDEVIMSHAEILEEMNSLLSANVTKDEFYRVTARVMHKIHQSDIALAEIKSIFNNN